MTVRPTTNLPSLLEAPLAAPHAADRLGRSLWLYLHLVRIANDRGMAIRTRRHLAEDLAVSEDTIDRWVERLVNAELVRVLSPSPYLAIALRFWSTDAVRPSPQRAEQQGEQASSHREVPVSSKQAAAAASSKAGDGSSREGGTGAEEIRQVLGDPELDVPSLVKGIPASMVRRALERVRQTPASQIRKSKTALFRFLLTKFSQEIDVQDL
jgi:hypothetical protein